jgi:hypothetical protein
MTDRKEALTELLAKVKAGEWHNDGTSWLFGNNWPNVHSAFHGSLDAAKALHEAVLPGWPVRLTDLTPDWCGGHGWCASLNYLHMEWQETFTAYPPSHFAHSAYNANPARAWLIAILKALIANAKKPLDS